MESTINFTVQLRPNLPEGTYYIVRSVEIDPNQIWINYGVEIIEKVIVTKANNNPEIIIDRISTEPVKISPISSTSATGWVIADILSVSNISIILSILALLSVGIVGIRRRQ